MTPQPEPWICLQSQESNSLNNGINHVSPDNRGLAYGDGFFTTMGVINGVIMWQDYHHRRIDTHAIALQLDIDSPALLLILQSQAQILQNGMLKLIVSRAAQPVRGYGFMPSESGNQCEMWLKATAMTIATIATIDRWQLPNGGFLTMPVPMQPVMSAVCLTARLACLPPSLAGLKSLNRLDNVLASGELQGIKQNQPPLTISLGEGLMRDMSGRWVEGTMSNVFYQLNAQKSTSRTPHQFIPSQFTPNHSTSSQWFTPPLDVSGVRGVMRAVIIDAFATSATPIIERPLTDEDLPQLSQLFFCNAVRGIMPMRSLRLLSGDVIGF